MDIKEKKSKREAIGKLINLANGRFKDHEISILDNLVNNSAKYNGLSKKYTSSFTEWSSDGKYTRNVWDTYKIIADKTGVYVKLISKFMDNDGQTGSHSHEYRTAREILKVIGKIL